MIEIWNKCEYITKNKEDVFDNCGYDGEYCYYQIFHEKCDHFKLGFKSIMEEAIYGKKAEEKEKT